MPLILITNSVYELLYRMQFFISVFSPLFAGAIRWYLDPEEHENNGQINFVGTEMYVPVISQVISRLDCPILMER